MAINLNKEGDDNTNSAPQPEKKGLNLTKEETKPASKLNLSKDSPTLDKNIEVPGKKALNLSKGEGKINAEFGDNSKITENKHERNPAQNEVPQSNNSNGTPKKGSKILIYAILGIAVIALAILFITKKEDSTIATAEINPEPQAAVIADAPSPAAAAVPNEEINSDPAPSDAVEEPAAPNTTKEQSVSNNTVSSTNNDDVEHLTIAQFEYGTSTVNSSDEKQITAINEYLAKKPSNIVLLTGYASSEGDFNFNKALSLERAMAMKDLLIQNGIDEKKILTEGGGTDKPIADNNTAAGRQQNRRVEFQFK